MILKTDAIVLRWHPFSNTSRVVVWMTRDHGRVSTLVKGSQRPKSPFLGQYDLFYTCELLYYAHDRDGLHIAKECSPLKTRDEFRTHWKATAGASYLADLVYRISPANAPEPGLYTQLDDALDWLAEHRPGDSFLFWFELKLLGQLGFAPRLVHCLDCGHDLLPAARHPAFSYARGGLLCTDCSHAEHAAARVSPEALGMMQGWQKAASPQAALSTRRSEAQADQIAWVLGAFLRYHLDTALPSRDIALDLLARRPG